LMLLSCSVHRCHDEEGGGASPVLPEVDGGRSRFGGHGDGGEARERGGKREEQGSQEL